MAPGRRASRLLVSLQKVSGWERKGARKWLLGVLFSFVLFLILAARVDPGRVQLEVGQVAPRDIVAPRTIEDRPRTARLREEAARQAVQRAQSDLSNYDISEPLAYEAETRVLNFFDRIEKARKGLLPPAAAAPAGAARDGRGRKPSAQDMPGGQEGGPPRQLVLQTATRLAEELSGEDGPVLSPSDVAAFLVAPGDVLERARTVAGDVVLQVMKGVRLPPGGLEDARAEVARRVVRAGLPSELEESVIAVAGSALRPNLILNPEKLRRVREEAMGQVEPVRILAGQAILRKGDPVTPDHVTILEDLGLLREGPNYTGILGLLLTCLWMVAGLALYLYRQHRELLENERLLSLLGLVILLFAALSKILALLGWRGAGFLAPVALLAMLVTILLDPRVAYVAVVLAGILVGLMFSMDGTILLTALVGGFTAVYSVSRLSQRSDLTRAGFLVGAANLGAMVGLGLFLHDGFLLRHAYLGVGNGLASAVAAIGFLPYLEHLFDIASAIKLLELSNPNQPLLRRLLMEAPGTYHHSLLVGNLSEGAAEAVGADPLLVRVGAAYHDIGKLRRPYFFAENQLGGVNPHERLTPTLSTLIIHAHVRDGVELARQAQLPEVIVDFIRQHHGTDLVRYFYQRAQANGQACVSEKDFRYPGPKPQTKEAAILMLADSVEAAVRSMEKPAPGRIEATVRRVIRERLEDGQLDEANLTLRELDLIGRAFVRTLSGIYHARIEYPQVVKEFARKRA